MSETKSRPIYRQRVAGYLMLRGFVLVAMKPNTDNSGRNVFYFKDSPELDAAIQDYSKVKHTLGK